MDIYLLRKNAKKTKKALLGRIENTEENLIYLRDLESWGSLEIIDSSENYIEYCLF